MKEWVSIVLMSALLVVAVLFFTEKGRLVLAHYMNYDKNEINFYGFYDFHSSKKLVEFKSVLNENNNDYSKSKETTKWKRIERAYNRDQGIFTFLDLLLVLGISLVFHRFFLRSKKATGKSINWFALIGSFAFFKYLFLIGTFLCFEMILCNYARGLQFLGISIFPVALILLLVFLFLSFYVFISIPKNRRTVFILSAPIGASLGYLIWWTSLAYLLL